MWGNSTDTTPVINGPVMDPMAGQLALIMGAGIVAPPSGQNEDNAYSAPPVQTGSYEYIIPQMFPDVTITNIDTIPTAFQDWSAYGVDSFDVSGLTGGGFTGDIPQVVNGPIVYYDQSTGLYVNLSQ